MHFFCIFNILKKALKYLLLFITVNTFSQNGEYFIKNYLPKDYNAHANNFAICQDNDGKLFVANGNGILIFDGINWTLNPSKDEAPVYSIFKSSNNIIYYSLGETNDFGVLEQQSSGKYEYNSFLSNLKRNELPTEAIKQIFEHNNSIYFLSPDKLIECKNSVFKTYTPINSFNIRPIKIGNHLFFIDLENQIQVLYKGVLKPVKNTESLSSHKAFFSYKINNNTYAIGFRDIGIYIAKYDSINPEKTTFEKFEVACDEELIESEIVNGSPLSDGNFIITSNKKGAFIIDKNLQIIKRLNTKTGLFENNVKAAFQDANGNLWLPNYYGISYVEINSPLLKYGRENGISGLVQASCYYKGNLFIGTDKGLQVFNSAMNSFNDVLGFNKQVWFLLNYNNILFICSAKGVFIYDGKHIKQISEESTTYLLNDPYQPNVIYAATQNGASVYNLSGSEFIFIKSYNLGAEVKSIAADYNKNIYFSTDFNGIYYLNFKKSYLIDSIKQQQGLPDDKRENYVFNYKYNLLIGTNDGIYAISQSDNKPFFCKKDPTFHSITKGIEIFRALEINGDLFCSETIKMENEDRYESKYAYFKNRNNKIIEDNSGISKLKGIKPNLISYDSVRKVILISADEGLYLLSQQNNTTKKTYNLFLGSLINNKEDTIAVNMVSSSNFSELNIEIPFADNNMAFKLGYSCFENPESVEFSYFLEGKDNDYRKWEKNSEIEFSNLFEGKYTLHVKTKNEISDQILEMHIPFVIVAPWYRSIFAYIIYGIVFILFLYIIIKLNTKRLTALNVKLEGIIKQRTSVIEEQVHLLEHQKQEITDSINYAQRIQQSILPSFKEISEAYKNCFIFFQPKDIVSGDFYWFKKINDQEFLIACADCTGHGVPGAFMSMICSEKLSEAVTYSTDPDKILYYTNNGIKEALRQNQQEEGKSKDGMEIALIRYNTITKTVSYSGANRPLWLIKNSINSSPAESGTNKEIIETKATKASIASFTEFNFEYKQHELVLESGDMVYLTTDGFPDQFGGPDGRKFMTKNMKTFLVDICNLPMEEQKVLVTNKINEWKGSLEQVDDLLVIGLKA